MTTTSHRALRSSALAAVLALAAATVAAGGAAAQTAVPPWATVAPKTAFGPVQPGIANRPAILLETDYYVYGPGVQFDVPELTINMDNRGYNQPATLYLYWQNRDTGQRMYYNVGGGFGSQERDLFGASADSPIQVFVPSLTDFKLFGAGSAFGPLPAAIPSNIGLYQFVFEVRNSGGTTVLARANAMYNQIDGVVPVNGNISGTVNWTNNNVYLLRGAPNFVTAGSRLDIEPGTVIIGSQSDQGTLVVRPGGQIFADGDAMRPIIFTSENPVGQRGPGDWGGLVISGNAPVNGGVREGEGDSGEYGGDNPADNSGILRFVRVEFAGIRFNERNELNGIALQGVGSGTTIEHVQVLSNSDDGIEFFGGTANAKYVLIVDARDDSVDWTFGWNGKMQHVVVLQRNQENDHGIEADNDSDNFDLMPRSNPTIYNATFVGNRTIQGSSAEHGWLLRRGTWATIRNWILTRFDNAAVEVEPDSAPTLNGLGNQVQLTHGVLFGNGGVGEPAEVAQYLNGVASVVMANPQLPAPNHPLQPLVDPLPGSPARSGAANPPNDGFFDTPIGYRGGVNPNDPWIDDGWTTFADN